MAGEPILVVDDNLLNVKLLRLLLETEGYQVRVAHSAEDALTVLQSFRPRLILLDIQLPGMDGLELARRLRRNPDTASLVIVALTAYAMKGDEGKVLSAGCDAYIRKPVDTRVLPSLLAEHLAKAESSKLE